MNGNSCWGNTYSGICATYQQSTIFMQFLDDVEVKIMLLFYPFCYIRLLYKGILPAIKLSFAVYTFNHRIDKSHFLTFQNPFVCKQPVYIVINNQGGAECSLFMVGVELHNFIELCCVQLVSQRLLNDVFSVFYGFNPWCKMKIVRNKIAGMCNNV